MPPRRKGVQTEVDEFYSMSVQELDHLIERATEARDSKIRGERRQFIEETRARAESLGMSLDDLLPREPARRGKKASQGGRKSAAVKYAGPNGETWTGRGRMPNWLAAAEAAGQNREEFLVDKG